MIIHKKNKTQLTLAKEEPRTTRSRILITLNMQLLRQRSRTAEELRERGEEKESSVQRQQHG